jgi:hypothetical protein
MSASEHPLHIVVLVCGQKHVLGDVDLDPVPLEDGVGRQDVDKAVEHTFALDCERLDAMPWR